MTAVPSRFPCPKCGAELAFDPGAGGLRCPFCGEERTLEAAGEVLEKDLAAALAAEAREAPAPRAARRFTCGSCGAVVEIPPEEKAGRCPWCGSSHVAEEEGGEARVPPESLIPFAVDRVGVENRFREWIRSLWFRPNALRHGSALGELRGVLVPFWTFDAGARSSWTALSGYFYTVTVGSGKSRHTVVRTRWVPSSGSRSDAYDDHLVFAGRGIDRGLLRKIEPYDLGGLVPYREDYLAGWAAESSSVDVRESWEVAEREIRESQVARCAGDVPGNTHANLSVETEVTGRRYRHCLLPVWVAAYRYRGKAWRFLVNGQTGEVQGEAPLSWVKIALLVLAIAAAAAIVALVAGR